MPKQEGEGANQPIWINEKQALRQEIDQRRRRNEKSRKKITTSGFPKRRRRKKKSKLKKEEEDDKIITRCDKRKKCLNSGVRMCEC